MSVYLHLNWLEWNQEEVLKWEIRNVIIFIFYFDISIGYLIVCYPFVKSDIIFLLSKSFRLCESMQSTRNLRTSPWVTCITETLSCSFASIAFKCGAIFHSFLIRNSNQTCLFQMLWTFQWYHLSVIWHRFRIFIIRKWLLHYIKKAFS